MDYQRLYRDITQKLQDVRQKEILNFLVQGILYSCSLTVGLALCCLVLESWLYGDSAFRAILFFGWCVAVMAGLTYFCLPALLQIAGLRTVPDDDELARRIGGYYHDLRDKLVNALQLYRRSGETAYTSQELALASFGTTAYQVQALDFTAIINAESRKKALMLCSIICGLFLLLAAIAPKTMGDAAYRLWHWSQSFVPPAPFSLVIQPAYQKVLRGESVEIKVFLHKNQTSFFLTELTLRVRDELHTGEGGEHQAKFESYILRPDSAGVFHYHIASIKRNLEFYAETPWYLDVVRSPVGKIQVYDRPDIRSLQGTVTPPDYTGQPPRSLDENSASLMSLAGSRVELSIIANKPLKSAELVLLKERGAHSADTTTRKQFDTTRIPMGISDRKAAGSFPVLFSGEYCIKIVDQNGEANDNAIHYPVLMIPDAAPTITMIQPVADVELSEQGLLPLKMAISDDYGFSALQLYYRLAESRYAPVQERFKVISLPFPRSEKSAEVPYVWDVHTLGISPSDRYEFYLEVRDNDMISGFKATRTAVFSARLPSLDEIFKDAEKTQDIAAKELQKMLKDAEQMTREMEDVNRELRKQQDKPQADWKEKKRLEDMLKKQEEMNKKLDDVRQQLEQMTDKLQQNQTISPETLKQYMELQKLMRQVDSPELRKSAQQLQKAMEQMTPQQMQQALQKHQLNEEDFKRAIERTMKILQRLQANQKADELSKRAQSLEQKQAELQKQLENSNLQDPQKREQLAQQQQELQKDFEKMAQELADLEKLMKDIEQKGGKDMPMDELKKAQEALQKEQTEQAMKEAQQQMQQGNQQQAREKQQQAKQNVQEFNQQMQQLKREMQRNVQQEAIRSMQKALQNMLSLSKRQEQLKQQTQSMDYNSNQFRDMAQEQSNVSQDMKNILSQLMELSQKSFSVTPEMAKELGDAMQQMENATRQLEERNASQSSQSQSGAMGAMNRAAMQMQQALGQMQGGQGQGGQGQGEQGDGMGQGGGMSFMERMQQMAAQQQAVNQGLQQMMEQQNGERLARENGEQAGRLAAQQEAIRQSIEEMNKHQRQSGKRVLGDLDRLAKEMQEIVSDMKSGNITEETVRRQERILSRLLDATRSTRERDYEKQRDAQSGKNVARSSPAEVDMKTQEGKNRALQELLQSIQQGYTKDYENLIRRYFDALQKMPVYRQ